MNNNGDNVLSPLSGNRLSGSRNTPPRMFRSPPPQPHMCVQDTLEDTNTTCFINVMSWSKIGLFDKPNAPIPMYGGVRVPLSDRCCVSSANSNSEKPLVFAVVANPYILQQSGKYADNLKERDGLIDLMLDFIEAMNKDVKFSRKFSVVQDRDLTGELKDIWNVIQAKRDADKSYYSSLTMGDENSRPDSPPSASLGQQVKHKRVEEDKLSMEPSVGCQDQETEAALPQAEARGDS